MSTWTQDHYGELNQFLDLNDVHHEVHHEAHGDKDRQFSDFLDIFDEYPNQQGHQGHHQGQPNQHGSEYGHHGHGQQGQQSQQTQQAQAQQAQAQAQQAQQVNPGTDARVQRSGASSRHTSSHNSPRTDRPDAGLVSPHDVFHSPMVAPQADPSDFTPLMSPAMTPLEHSRQYQQSMPDVGLPGTAYFSPLSSPVIEQQQQQQQQTQQQQRRFRQRSAHQTPVLGPSSTASRVTKIQPGSAPSGGGKRSLSSASMSSPRTGPNGAGAGSGGGGGTSSSESISPPEIVPDISMPPPPPQVKRDANSSNSRSQSTVPVTPSSLMNLAPAGNSRARSESSSSSTTVSEDKVNSALRATANASSSSRPSSRRSSSVASGSSNASPHIRPRPPSISPAIRPRLSPGTSPTIAPERVAIYPSSGKDDLSALLASKSNYQTIVEGKHSQLGLQYPEQLSAELTSKRTSHKLAEQGRRNRINVALQELADLVAPNAAVNSKANTVETAIKYIKRLQTELDMTKEKLAKYEKAQPKDN